MRRPWHGPVGDPPEGEVELVAKAVARHGRYRRSAMLESDVDRDPLVQFHRWLEEARAAVRVPEAMALATASGDGAPSLRMVLLKEAGEDGFAFFSGYDSRKGRDLAANPRAALLFHWDELGRQVRVEGPVERLPEEASDAYFATRPAGAQAAARGTRQGEVVETREELEAAARRAGPCRRPDWWGGYLLRPQAYEFWQHREDRLHDRLRYQPDGAGWRIVRLAP
ncbi:MAG: pyridoxamine 5'-phosphate oxidase [Gaiellaceae bacterium]